MANVKDTTEVVKTVAAKKVEEAKEAVKTVAKAAQAKAEEAKAVEKAEEKVEQPVVETAKAEEKVEEKTAVPVKEEKTVKRGRKAAKEAKAAAKKVAAEPKVYIQFGAGESAVEAIVEKIKAEYVDQGHRVSSIKDLRVYLKPEDGAAYYVINEKVAGRVDLF